MLRLNQADFDDPHELAKLAATASVSVQKFRDQFYYVIENDLLYENIKKGNIKLISPDSNVAHKPLGEIPADDSNGIEHHISPE